MPGRRSKRFALALIAAALTTGCQTGGLTGSPPRNETATLAALTRYGNDVRELDSAQLDQQHRELIALVSESGDATARIKLGLLLSDPDAPFYDDVEAMRVLGDVMLAAGPEPSLTSDFARLVHNLLRERAGELDEIRGSLAAERTQRETLQGQLDALKSLERQISLEGIEDRN